MAAMEKKPRGRPRRYIGDRPNWTIRLEEKYGDQVRQIAEGSGRSISDVCSELIVNAFRLQIMCDVVENKNEELTKQLQEAETAFKLAHASAVERQKRIDDLENRLDVILRSRGTTNRFGRPRREKKP